MIITTSNEQQPLLRGPSSSSSSIASHLDGSQYGSLSQNADNTLSRDVSWNATAEEENFIQLRRGVSVTSPRMQHLGLTMSKDPEDGRFLEVEASLAPEVRMITKMSIPLIITFLLQYSLTVASVYAVGNLGADELAAVSLSNLLASISSYGIIQGTASALSTLCPQAYGRKDYKTVGLQSLRCACLLLIIYIPIFAVWYWGSYPILNFLAPGIKATYLASRYLRRLSFGVPGFIVFEVTKQYLQAQGIFHASTWVLAFCAPLNVALNITLVWDKHIGMGFEGAPTAVSIINWLMAIMLVLYAAFINGYQCWCGFSKEVFKHWGRLLTLAGPGVLMIEAEWLAFEIIAIASSRFGTVALAAQSIVATTCVTVYQIPYAISVAASTRIAWYIGSASEAAAHTATNASLIVATGLGFVNAFSLAALRTYTARLFTHDEDVIVLASRVLLVGAAYQLGDVLSCVAGGILRGQGRQYIGGWLNLTCYYVIALPVSYYCGFHLKLGLPGLWLGMVVALGTISIGAVIAVLTTNWRALIQKSVEDGLSDYQRTICSDSTSLLSRNDRSVAARVSHNMLSPVASASGAEIMAS